MTPAEQEGGVYPGNASDYEPTIPSLHKGKLQCVDCGRCLDISEVEVVPDPKVADNSWRICPHCRSAGTLFMLCQFGECKQLATCGSTFGDVYVHCCGDCLKKWGRILIGTYLGVGPLGRNEWNGESRS